MTDTLILKWGTLKGWDLNSDAAKEALRKYGEIGEHAAGAMQQRDTSEQKQALCDLIDAVDGTIENDWTGDTMTKAEAKEYVLTYGAGR